ncbi:MAG: hypothetical protein M3Q19_06355 [Pseudomonadota bacterium]|nr:hypothetical protein [Pseudomonadota bacterium]
MFTRGSRYESVGESEVAAPGGRIVRYKRIRFVPATSGQAGYVVQEGDRPDTAAWNIAQDPEAYWRLCDANGTIRPSDLTREVGSRIIIPDPTAQR